MKLKDNLKRFLLAWYGFYIYKNLLLHFRLWHGDNSSGSGATHSHLTVEESLSYIDGVFKDYKQYGSIRQFSGRVCEVGPGDNLGVAMRILADGADQVDCADRFYTPRNPEHHASIYQAVCQNDAQLKTRFSGVNWSDETFPGLRRYYGREAAVETFFDDKVSTYDFIVSRSVLEHVTDPLMALDKMFRALKPGGKMIHKVDLRDHGTFSQYFHELKFLEIPSWLYFLMTYDSGYPNRIMVDAYRDCALGLPGKSQILVTKLAYVKDVIPYSSLENIDSLMIKASLEQLEKVKHRFSRSLRQKHNKDLIVAGFFLILEKDSTLED